jgi:hypothetical protein
MSSPDAFPIRGANAGVTMTVSAASDASISGGRCARVDAENRSGTPDGAWTRVGKTFSPTLNLYHRGLGCWIHGDGQGELLNIQIASPENVTPGLADHYVVLDFTGWRYIEMVEPESERLDRYTWPYSIPRSAWRADPQGAMRTAFAAYQPWVDYGQIGRLSLWLNNLPPGKKVEVLVGPIKALPLQPATLVDPRVTIGGRTITFPTAIESGCYLEYTPPARCDVYGPAGERLRTVVPQGHPPIVVPGENEVRLRSDTVPGLAARATVTVITRGTTFAGR